MSDGTYNGWANYPTWNVNLWLANDQGLDELVREQARLYVESDLSCYPLADWLKDELCAPGGEYGLIPELEGFPADLMSWALASVDWQEIARHWMQDARDES